MLLLKFEERENVLKLNLQYLGKLDNVSGYTLFDEGEVVSVLGIHTNTLVFPGFILPLVMQSHYENAVMLRFIETKNVFVLICAEYVKKNQI